MDQIYKVDPTNSIEITLGNRKFSASENDLNSLKDFINEERKYVLTFIFNALTEEGENPFVTIECKATFAFENINTFEEIPSYFYRNSIAIIFPYIRAYISTVTLQANIPPVVLPTMNLASLEKPLKENTLQK